MMTDSTITRVHGRRIWDSRGRPTVEVEVHVAGEQPKGVPELLVLRPLVILLETPEHRRDAAEVERALVHPISQLGRGRWRRHHATPSFRSFR